MTRRLATIWLTTVLLIGVGSPSMGAQVADVATPTLKGISALNVRIADLSEDAKVLGLTKDAIQTDVELKLRLAGMRVVTMEEDFNLPGTPFLYINVNLTDTTKAGHIEVELRQNAQLERNGQLALAVTTWRTGGIFANTTAQHIRDSIKDSVDEFLNAWLSVNPKK
jgi:hypothetical protein